MYRQRRWSKSTCYHLCAKLAGDFQITEESTQLNLCFVWHVHCKQKLVNSVTLGLDSYSVIYKYCYLSECNLAAWRHHGPWARLVSALPGCFLRQEPVPERGEGVVKLLVISCGPKMRLDIYGARSYQPEYMHFRAKKKSLSW